MAIIASINIGQPEPIPGKSAKTGIFKRPIDGEVAITRDGLVGDAILNRKHHGGKDQAVYLYFRDDYDWWSKELDAEIGPGVFGENLTIGGVEGRKVAIGDRFIIDEVVLEVTSHRTPCMVFAARMGDPRFAKRFHQAGRPGAYCRVIKEGAFHAGEPVRHEPFAGERITVAEMMALDGRREIDPDFMRRALTTPVHYKTREDYQDRLARLF
ncbi:MOSC domain-containing protein [Devosia sp. J2-20]|jgi:MOSC domain-containing protein YiiM|uniref:MOSC domain-containing protein n=1 Tax=Devosia litorisediminis TaxID=2829817 RepID=A0A942I7G1_9HYPH|nr:MULTISPECIES: MOSC domain-containing protein [Devosia]MBS3850118.1 MOSC domain-containing protein [Devosia litorisediminis]WDQ99892.1 MOSC domain-containing protein [Devosia sp. J2-20]